MSDLTKVLGGPWKPPDGKRLDPAEIQFENFMRSMGIEPPEQIILDGQIHRFGGKNKPLWYIGFGDGIPAGRCGDWREGTDFVWRAEVGRDLTPAEVMAQKARLKRLREERAAARAKQHETVSDVVSDIWSGATLATGSHPYLARKGIEAHGARVTGDGRLIVPLYDESGKLSSVQYISEDGDKRYHTSGKTRGCFYRIGSDDSAGSIFIAEGFATAASIHEETGRPCVATYSASNIVDVCKIVRSRDPHREIVIVADNDESGVGARYAEQAAATSGARVVVMPERGQDANDYVQSGGDLSRLLEPEESDWLVPADQFAKEPAPIRWLIKHWVQRDAMMMVHGPSGGGKTFLVLDWILTISGGLGSWFGNKVRPCSAVYLAGEGHHGLRARVAAWKHAKQVESLDLWISRAGTDLNEPQGLQQARHAIQSLPSAPAIIVIDTLHRFLSGDENSSQDAKTMLDACSVLMQEFKATVVLVHHTGVSDEAQHRARGSSAWRGALDVEVSVVPPKGDGPISVIQRKMKDGEMADPLYFDLDRVEIPGWIDEDGEKVSSAILIEMDKPEVGRPKNDQENIRFLRQAWHRGDREMVEDRPYVARSVLREILLETGLSAGTVTRYLKPSGNGFIQHFLETDLIEATGQGWTILDQNIASAWALER